MANSLIKNTKFVPGVPGRGSIPARLPSPARDVWETRTVCGYRPTNPNAPGHYEFITSPGSYQTTAVWVPDALAPGSGNAGAQVGETVYACWEEQVLVRYPADPGAPAVPGIASIPARFDYNLGWDSGARSLMFVTGDANATFQAKADMVGAIVGLNGWQDPLDYTGTSIKFGFYLTHGFARVVEEGETKTSSFAYTAASVFKIDRTSEQITYYLDDTLVYTSAVDDSTEALWLQASLYSGDDEVFNPTLNQVSELDDETEVAGSLALSLPPVGLYLGAGDGGRLNLTLPSVEMDLQTGLFAPSFGLLSIVLPPLQMQFSALVGTLGSLDMSLPPVGLAIADAPTGRLRLPLPGVRMNARQWPRDTLYMDGWLQLGGAISAHGVVTLPAQPLVGVLGGAVSPYAEVTLGTVTMVGLLGGNMGAQGEVTLPVQPFVGLLGGSISILSGLNEVWVLNFTDGRPGGTTRYEGYDFNSFAKIGGRYYGARHDGLFLLEGADDAGAPIEASFGFGQLNFGNPQKKTVSHAYLGAAAGAMRLKLDALLNGAPASFTYAARGHGETMREVRFTLGKGLKSTYVVPTFSNVNGDAFEVDTVSFQVADLARKI